MCDAQDPEHGAQVRRHRLLAREEHVALILDRVRQGVDLLVVLHDLLCGGEVAVEQRLGATGDRLGDQRGDTDHIGAQILELLVEGLSCFGLGVLRGAHACLRSCLDAIIVAPLDERRGA